MNHRNLLAALLPALLACSASAPSETPSDGGAPTPDGGLPDAGPPAARYLVAPKGLFGDSPIDNRFLNPNFDLNAEGWLAFPTRSGATRLPTVQRRFEAGTPTRQPLLLIPKEGNDFGVGVVGTARAGVGPFEVQVWVGRPEGAADTPLEISVIGTHYQDGELAWSLSKIDGSDRVQGSLHWAQYGVRLDAGPVGFANLVVIDDSEVPIYLSGPVMLPGAQMAWTEGPPPPRGLPRPVRAAEARALSAIRARLLRDMGRRPPRVRLPARSPTR